MRCSGFSGVGGMKFVHGVKCAVEAGYGLPGVVFWSITGPSYKVLDLFSVLSGIKNSGYFIYDVTVNLDWGRSGFFALGIFVGIGAFE